MKIYKLKYAGKSPNLSQDALKFTEEAYNFLLQNGFKNGFHRIVENNGVKKDIWLMIVARHMTDNTGRGASDAGKEWGTISIINDLDLKDKNNIIDFIKHELIHCFSIRALPQFEYRKDNEGNEINKWNKPMIKTDDPQANLQYYNMPDEQDAYMYEKAQRLFSSLYQQNKNIKSIKDAISKLQPSDEIEKAWYQDKNSWKKFLNTLYQMISF